jgi:hypothetical protein
MHPLFKSAMRRMQRGAPVNAHGLCGFLKLVLTGLVVFFIIIAYLVFVTASVGPLLLLLSLAVAASPATTLLARSLSTVLGLLLVSSFVLSSLLLNKLLNLPAVLEIMALGAMDLTILLAGAFRLVGSRQGLAGGAPGNFLAGVVNLGLLGSAGVAGFLDSKHGLASALLVPPPAFLWRGCSVFVF